MGALDGLIAASIRHRVAVLFLALGLIGAGIFAVPHATLDVLPDLMPARVVVQTEARGFGVLDVETLVTTPIERALRGTPDLADARSVSSPGLSVVTLVFADGVDVYRARQLVTERLDPVRAELPRGVEAPQLAPVSPAIGTLAKLAVSLPRDASEEELRALRTWGDWVLKPRLQAIPGIASVPILGGMVERLEVQADPVRLAAHGVSLAALADGIARAQAPGGAGFVEPGPARLAVRAETRLAAATAIADLERAVVAAPAENERAPIAIADVARVTWASEPPVGAARYDDRPAIYAELNKLPDADALAVTTELETTLAELAKSVPPRAKLEPLIFRQADFIRTSIHGVGRAMLLGGALVVLVLLLFLRSLRLSLISLTAIPLSILAALGVLVAAGVTLNTLTLGGLAIAVGEVVDDAIVDVENVWRRLRLNATLDNPRPPLEVVAEASREVRSAVVFATLIVGLVLVPVLTLGGVAGRLFAPLAVAYLLAIAASLLVALTVTPALCALLLPRLAQSPRADHTVLARWLLARYRATLARVVRHPRIVLGGAALLGIGAAAALPLLGGEFLPEFQEGSLIAHLKAAPTVSLASAIELAAAADRALRPTLAVHTAARAGRASLDEDASPVSRMEMDVLLPLDADDHEAATAALRARLASVPGVVTEVEGFLAERLHELLAGDTAPLVVEITGPDLPTLRRLAAAATDIMNGVPGVGPLTAEPSVEVPELTARPRRDALLAQGVSAADLAEALVRWRQGEALGELYAPGGRVINLVLAGPPELRTRAALPDLPVATHGGAGPDLPLAALATLIDLPVPSEVTHVSGERRIGIGAALAGISASAATDQLRAAFAARLALPPEYHVALIGEGVARAQASERLLVTSLLALLGTFVLLVLAFGVVKDALVVLVNLPLGLVGGVAAALATPEGLSVSGFVGFITLFGISARNGVMLVAHLRQLALEAPELDARARALRAAEERLIPILMTAATAFLGLLPMALSLGKAGSELEAPMALIVCGGLATSTALTLIVLPTIYVLRARPKRSQSSAPSG